MSGGGNAWEEFFDSFSSRYMDEPFVAATVAEADFIERELHLSPGAAVLDLGCGTGRHSVELARRGYRVTGLDLSAGMLKQARAAAAAAGVTVTWVRADATTYRGDARFDAVLCLCEGSLGLLAAGDDAVEHDLGVLRTMAHALCPGGRFLLTALNVFRFARAAPGSGAAAELGAGGSECTDAAAGAGEGAPSSSCADQSAERAAPARVFDPATSSESSVMSWTDGEEDRCIAVRERSFTSTELSLLCRVAGLQVDWAGGGTAGSWGRRPLDLDEYEIMVMGRAAGGAVEDEEPHAPGGTRDEHADAGSGANGGPDALAAHEVAARDDLLSTRSRAAGRARVQAGYPPGTLFVCATPIGNLGDVTLRTLQTLERVRLIAAEDTRHARKLLSYYDIHTPATSLFAHNEAAKTEVVLRELRQGNDVALVTDAGMPGISDPGGRAVAAVIAAGVPVTILPGASAPVTALVASGLVGDAPWCFAGFLPRRAPQLRKAWAGWRALGLVVVCFETAMRLPRTLRELAEIAPHVRMAVCRELTKLHEEVARGTVREMAGRFTDGDEGAGGRLRGELTLVFDLSGPGDDASAGLAVSVDPEAAARRLLEKDSAGATRRSPSQSVSACGGAKRMSWSGVSPLRGRDRSGGAFSRGGRLRPPPSTRRRPSVPRSTGTLTAMDIVATAKARTVILDGAMGTQLMARGFASETCPEEWNVSHADVVAEVHAAYYAAGADAVLTNTLGGTRAKLVHYGLEGRVAELNSAAARLATRVRDAQAPGRFVGGDIGPTGRFLKPLGDLEPDEVRDMFAEQAAALLEGGVDCFVIETMFDLAETCLAVEGCRRVTDRPVLASMTFGVTPRGYRTMMGVEPRQAAHALVESGADAVGCNCSIGAEQMVELVGALVAATDVPVLAEPNAGQPRLDGEQTVYDETPKHFAANMKLIVRQGASLVGGCCGTSPQYIAALVKALRA